MPSLVAVAVLSLETLLQDRYYYYSLLLIPSLIFFFFFFSVRITRRGGGSPPLKKEARPPPPPSPPRLPIVGNLHQLGALPHRSLHALSRSHGPVMLLRLGRTPALVVSSADAAREVMVTQDAIFADRPSLTIPLALLYGGRDVAFARYGEYWRRAKKLSVLHLLSHRRVQSYKLIREQEVALMVERIAGGRGATAINLSETLNGLAKDIISRVVLGERGRGEWHERIAKVIEESSELMGAVHVGDYLPWLAWLGAVTGLDARVARAFEEADVILEKLIEEQLAGRKDGESEGKGESQAFIDILLSLQRDQIQTELPLDKENIKAIIKDMFGAGTDSIYITMEWIIAELIRNPETMKKLKDEIREIGKGKPMIKEEDLVKTNYLKCVIKEALRLHPPGPLLVPRQLMEDTQIQGYQVPSQALVLINVWTIGRDPTLWEAPERFWPERFAGSPIDFNGHDFQLSPFGSGRRICPGINFSVPIIELTIANLVHRFDLKLAHGMREQDMDMGEAPGLTTRKRTGLCCVAIPCSY